VLARYR